MDFRLLGPLEVWDGDRQVAIAGTKRRAVLALLLLHANEVVSTDQIIDRLWSENAPKTAAASLHNHVSRLRKALGPDLLATHAWGYVLRVDPEQIDLHRFERLVADAEPLPASERSAKLADALALWRGPALADLAFEPALTKDLARLEELRLAILEARLDADLEIGRNTEIIGELEALVAEHPLRERLRGNLILALYRDGRQAEALEVYRETRRLLADELGLEPSPALRDLERAILRQDASLAPLVSAAQIHETAPSMRRRWLVYAALGAAVLAAAGIAILTADVFQTSGDSNAAGEMGQSTAAQTSSVGPSSQGESTSAAKAKPKESRLAATRRRAQRPRRRLRVASRGATAAAATRPASSPPHRQSVAKKPRPKPTPTTKPPSLAAPPMCASPSETPNASLSSCQAHFFAPRVALTSQSVLLTISDWEATRADCATYSAAQTTTFAVDGEPVLYTTVPCQHVTHSIDNVITLPLLDAPTAWGMQDRYLIPARTLTPGTHTLTWTSTFLSDYSYSLGCTDPSGRCTTKAGTVATSTTNLTITD
jgi:DNA-binding SARP family transcriptional activator